MQPRDPSRLESGEFDVLVVGGGIQGLTIAYEAASRGLRTALIDASDFGSGTSFNHQKTVHGGLRSLQAMRLDRARESIRERRALARIAPWFLRPLPFIIGTYRSATRSRPALRAAFLLDRWLGRDRNNGVERELHLPAPKLLSRALTLKLFAGIEQRNLTGGAQWYDYQMVESDRLTLAFAAGAERAGAVLANYVEATGAIRSDGRIGGVTATDRETGRTFAVRAAVTVNAAGARAGEVMRLFDVGRPVPMLAAMNLVTSKQAKEIALAAPTRAGHMLTLVPWRGRAIVGTSHSSRLVTTAEAAPSRAEVETFVREANEAFPALGLTLDDVTWVHRGLVAAEPGRDGPPRLRSAPGIYDHAHEGTPGVMSVIAVKYTTARAVAERVVSAVGRRLGRRLRRSTTAVTPLPGAAIADHEGLAIETARRGDIDVTPATITRLATLYAHQGAEIIRVMAERPELGEVLDEAGVVTAAEIVHVIRHEAAIHLTDIVLRRTTVGAAGHPGADLLQGVARIAGRELGWTEDQIREEIAAVEAFYRTS